MTSLPRRFTRNALSNYAGLFVSLVVTVGVTPIMIRGLGKEGYGVWGLATSVVQYFGLLQFGFGSASVRYVAAYHERGETDRLLRVIATSAYALMIPGAFVLLLSPGLAFLFPQVFHVPHSLVAPAMILVTLAAIDLGCSIPSDTFGATLIGLQRYDLLNLTVAGTSLAQAAAWAAVIAFGGGLVGLGLALLGFSLAGQLSRYLFARRIVGTKLLRRRYFERGLVDPLLRMSGWIAVLELADVVNAEIGAIIVGIIDGVSQAAVYLVGQKLANLIGSFTTPVQVMFYPHAAQLSAAGDQEGLRRSALAGTRISLAIAMPMMMILVVLAKPAVRAWAGPGYSSAAVVIVCLGAATVVNMLARTLVDILRGLGNVRAPAIFAVLITGLNLPLSVVLALAIGFQGVALATLITEVIVSFGLSIPYSCRHLQVSIAELLRVALRPNLLPSLAAVAVGLVLVHVGLSGLAAVTGAGAAMLLTYAAVLFLTGLSSTERRIVRDRLAASRLRRVQAS